MLSIFGVRHDEVVSALQCVFGIAGICPMVQIEDKGYEDLKEQVLKFIDETYPDKNFTFKVDTRRANKQYPTRRIRLTAIWEKSFWRHILRQRWMCIIPTYFFTWRSGEKYKPLLLKSQAGRNAGGNERQAMLLLSGGIDSPVAGYMIAKEGVIEATYFHAPPYTSERAKQKVRI